MRLDRFFAHRTPLFDRIFFSKQGSARPIRLPFLVSSAFLLLISISANANQTATPLPEPNQAAPATARTVAAHPVETRPIIDGDVLHEAIWRVAPIATDFIQNAPDEGNPATERTEVRIIYTNDTLYFGVICYDREPESIITSTSRRDSSMNDADSFQLILDTFNDDQNGFIFGTTPSGQEYDGQVINEGGSGGLFGGGGGGGFSRGGGGGFNLNWDGAWQIRTKITEIGWTAEFAIPFSTIRYANAEQPIWGVNFQRNLRRRNETAFWAPLPRQYNLYRLSLAGTLLGLRPPGNLSRNLQLTPYAVGKALTRDAMPARHPILTGDAGIDLKYTVTSGLTIDGTYNTDFAQVEVDDQQINLDRFNLFFPEKRPFFLENAGAFTVSNEGASRAPDLGQTDLFFSRRIGISNTGQQIPILAGTRLSGKISQSTTIGFLNMQTEDVTGVGAANNFTVFRGRRDLPNRSSLGPIFINRVATGTLSQANDYNRTYAVDGRWGLGQNGLVQGFYGRTETPGRSGRDHALNVAANYSSESWRLLTSYQENGEDFNPEVGFVRRTGGFRKFDFGINNTSRPNGFLKFQELTPHMSFSRFWNFSGVMETSFLHMHFSGEFDDSSTTGAWYDVKSERVLRPFTVSGIPILPGRYDFSETQYSFRYNRSAPISFGVSTTAGGFFDGTIVTFRPSLRMRYEDVLNLSLSYSRNDIDLPGGSTVTNLASARFGYNITPRVFLQALLQHNDSANVWSSNVRFGWLNDANTGLFLVYNEIEGISDYVPLGAGRSLILKFSHLIDVLN